MFPFSLFSKTEADQDQLDEFVNIDPASGDEADLDYDLSVEPVDIIYKNVKNEIIIDQKDNDSVESLGELISGPLISSPHIQETGDDDDIPEMIDETSENEVDFDSDSKPVITPESYKPPVGLSTSPHLEFVQVSPDSLREAKSKISLIRDMLNDLHHPQDPHSLDGLEPWAKNTVSIYLNREIRKLKSTIDDLKYKNLMENSTRLAERIIHKYKKWGPVRFGKQSRCQACFYCGQRDEIKKFVRPAPHLRSALVTFDDRFHHILQNLHLCSICENRFGIFFTGNEPCE